MLEVECSGSPYEVTFSIPFPSKKKNHTYHPPTQLDRSPTWNSRQRRSYQRHILLPRPLPNKIQNGMVRSNTVGRKIHAVSFHPLALLRLWNGRDSCWSWGAVFGYLGYECSDWDSFWFILWWCVYMISCVLWYKMEMKKNMTCWRWLWKIGCTAISHKNSTHSILSQNWYVCYTTLYFFMSRIKQ